MAAHRRIDWDRIEPDWRAGIKSVLQIAAEYTEKTGDKVTHTGINKHFKELGVTRDLAAKVRAKADAIVSASIVSGKVSIATTETAASIINENAMVLATVHLSQRKDISRARTLVMTLLSELELQTGSIGLLEQLAELLYDQGADDMTAAQQAAQDKRMELFNKVISLNGRTGTMKSLADSLKTLVALEREAFGMDEKKPTGGDGQMTIIQI